MEADLAIAIQVRDKLHATRRDLGGVAVVVDQGQICLRGPVASYYLRQVAVERARRVAGVYHVADEMRVEDGDGTSPTVLARPLD